MLTVFLDTNIYLHAKPVTDIPWRDVLGNDVHILVPRITVQELDEQKDTHARSTIRDRARRALQLIETWTTPTTIRTGVTAEYLHAEPTHLAHGLRNDRADDILIGTILQYQTDHPETSIVLITNDTGPRLTAQHHNLTARALPSEHLLPNTPDPVAEENNRLKSELAKIQNAKPRLKIAFPNGERLHHELTPTTPFDTAAAATTMTNLRTEYERIDRSLAPLAIPTFEYARYHRDQAMFFKEYEEYLRHTWTQGEADKRTVKLPLLLENTGGEPATNLDITVTFRAKAALVTLDPRHRPAAPPPPVLPREEPAATLARFQNSVRIEPPNHYFNDTLRELQRNVSTPEITTNENQHEITWHVKNLKHGNEIDLGTLYLVFASHEETRSCTIKWTAHANEYPEAFTGELHLIIKHNE